MWTKREMVEFKDAIRKEGGDAIIKVSVGPIPIPKGLGFTFIWVFLEVNESISLEDLEFTNRKFPTNLGWPRRDGDCSRADARRGHGALLGVLDGLVRHRVRPLLRVEQGAGGDRGLGPRLGLRGRGRGRRVPGCVNPLSLRN